VSCSKHVAIRNQDAGPSSVVLAIFEDRYLANPPEAISL
jgi:hypothetical protein